MTRIRDLERNVDEAKNFEESRIAPTEAWRRFLAGDYDPDNPDLDERIQHWIEVRDAGVERRAAEDSDVDDSEAGR